jgi:hypothetical protein
MHLATMCSNPSQPDDRITNATCLPSRCEIMSLDKLWFAVEHTMSFHHLSALLTNLRITPASLRMIANHDCTLQLLCLERSFLVVTFLLHNLVSIIKFQLPATHNLDN